MTFPDIGTHGGRRAWAFVAIVGGCMTMTVFAAVGVWMVRNNVGMSFWLALAAHGQVLVGMTALAALFVKRSIEVSRAGIKINDFEAPEAAQAVADAAQDEADAIKTGPGNTP